MRGCSVVVGVDWLGVEVPPLRGAAPLRQRRLLALLSVAADAGLSAATDLAAVLPADLLHPAGVRRARRVGVYRRPAPRALRVLRAAALRAAAGQLRAAARQG